MEQGRKKSVESQFNQPHLLHRTSGDASHPALVYLPGVHGDWTPLWKARPILQDAFQLIEIAYPRMTTWRLTDFAGALERILDHNKINQAHLVGESFGSLVGWEFALTRPERVSSLTLVGGFSQPPLVSKANLARWGLKLMPTPVFESGVNAYCAIKGKKTQKGIETGEADAMLYPAVRTHGGRLATANRLQLIGEADYRAQLPTIRVPVRYVGGGWDMIVPVRREIRTLENALPKSVDFRSHLIPRAPHMIIATHPDDTTRRIIEWARETNS